MYLKITQLFLFVLLVANLGTAQIVLPVDFESTTIDYAFTGFGGGELSVIDNPDMSGINTSAKVAQMVKGAGEVFGGAFFELDCPIDFTMEKEFKVKVWAPAVGTKVLFKVENSSNGGIFAEIEQTTTMAMAWEELTFDFATISTTESYQKVVLIFENGTAGDGSAAFTYYVDDITLGTSGCGPVVAGDPVDLPVTFDDADTNYSLADFGGNTSSIVVDPTDATNMVGQAVKSDAAELWAGTTMGGDGLASVIALTATSTTMTARVWAPNAGTIVRMKVENKNDNTVSVETEATVTAAMTWETLTFDFANEAAGTAAFNAASTYDKVSIFFDFGMTGMDMGEARTYYWDDVAFDGGVAAANPTLPIGFESSTIEYTRFDFGMTASAIIDNPDATGANTSSKVLEIVKLQGAETWAGVAMPLEGSIDLSPAGATMFSVTVWSPRAGVDFLLKIEDGPNAATVFAELPATTTVANSWETLTYDMTTATGWDATAIYNQVVVFPDFGTAGADETFYVDDIKNDVEVSISKVDLAKVKVNAYPNPVEGELNVNFTIPVSGKITFSVIDVLGQKIQSATEENMTAGTYQRAMNMTNVSSGMYYLVMRLDGEVIATKNVMVK